MFLSGNPKLRCTSLYRVSTSSIFSDHRDDPVFVNFEETEQKRPLLRYSRYTDLWSIGIRQFHVVSSLVVLSQDRVRSPATNIRETSFR